MSTTERIITLVAAIIAIFVFVTGIQSLKQWRSEDAGPKPSSEQEAGLATRTASPSPTARDASTPPTQEPSQQPDKREVLINDDFHADPLMVTDPNAGR